MADKTNDQLMLERKFKQKHEQAGSGMGAAEFFEIFTASEILKNKDLGYEEIISGIVGKGNDGGIDSIYTFLNGKLLKEEKVFDDDLEEVKIELYIIQSKMSSSFSGVALSNFRESAEDLFSLSKDLDGLAEKYNEELRTKIALFRDVYERFLSDTANLYVNYFYVTQGDEIHPNVESKIEPLRKIVSKSLSDAKFKFNFVGARDLLKISRDVPSSKRILAFSQTPIMTPEGSYICLVNLKKYYSFLTNKGELARNLFESNVRDFQGSKNVNSDINETLKNNNSDNFWFLNNGVTILAPSASIDSVQLVITNPQIVNGLQTSHMIYKHFSNKPDDYVDNRSLLVRVICERNEAARDRIIKATNSQTAIPSVSLRSSDEIHRNIEEYLKPYDIFYDRKKNYYKNEGKAISKIVSIPYMAQAVMSIILFKPDDARARPSTVLNDDEEYKKIFNSKMPLGIYLKSIKIMKEIENFLLSKKIDKKVITNIKYYVAMTYGLLLTGGKVKIKENIMSMDSGADHKKMLAALSLVTECYEDLGATDQVAKGNQLKSMIFEKLKIKN